MKILLLGKDGQVGHELQRTLLPLGPLQAHNRSTIDLSQLDQLQARLDAYSPDVIVNAAAYTAVDKAESDADAAHRINSQAVQALAQYATARSALLVHYSTDYVFDGAKAQPYLPDDQTNPQSVYGASKLAGEEAILASGCAALVFRTSWVFSAYGGNFVKTILRLARERDTLNIVSDQHGAPTSAELIADVTAHAILAHAGGRLRNGIHHLSASGSTSWLGLAKHVAERALKNGAPLKATPDRIAAIRTEQYPLPARRPKNSRLDTSELQQALGLQLPHWSVHADRTVDQLTLQERST